MSAPATPPIIIIKKKSGHGGHHGGAWKVAYADFVTAMMAFFIVMWLLSASQDVKKAIAGYFRDPKGSGKQVGSGLGGVGESIAVDKKNISALKDKLEEAMKQSPKFEKLKDHVQMTVTGEGLRIELLENDKGMFFAGGQAAPTEMGRDLLSKLAEELAKMKNSILIEGHTDAKKYGSETYSNWELSADRANAARKIMQESGLGADRVSQVRGFADQQPRVPENPEDPSNRRVTIIVQYLQSEAPEASAEKGEGGEEGGEGEGHEKKAEGGAKPEGSHGSAEAHGKEEAKPKQPEAKPKESEKSKAPEAKPKAEAKK